MGDVESKDIKQTENLVVVVENGPKFVEITEKGLSGRANLVKSEKIDPVTSKINQRSFSEEEGLGDLLGFVQETLKVAEGNGDEEVAETSRLFKENLVFVGEQEFLKATQGIAQHLVEEVRKGKTVVVFAATLRSERYVSLRILEEIDCLLEETPGLRERIKLTESPEEAAKKCQECLGNCLVAVPDDFVLTGRRIERSCSSVYSQLLSLGFAPGKASEMVEAEVVALKLKREGDKLTVGQQEAKRDLRVFSYYGVPEYRNAQGEMVAHPAASMTGSHCSTDYGFENVLRTFQEYLKSKGVEREMPLLTYIVRPYEMAGSNSMKYKNEELQKRWETIQEKYALKEIIKIPIQDKRMVKDPFQVASFTERLRTDKVQGALASVYKLLGDYVQARPQELSIEIIEGSVGEGTIKGRIIEIQLPNRGEIMFQAKSLVERGLPGKSETEILKAAEELIFAIAASTMLHEGVHGLLDSKPGSKFAQDFVRVTGLTDEGGKRTTLLDEGIAYAVQGLYAPKVDPIGSLAPVAKEGEKAEVARRKKLGEALKPKIREYLEFGRSLDSEFLSFSAQEIIKLEHELPES